MIFLFVEYWLLELVVKVTCGSRNWLIKLFLIDSLKAPFLFHRLRLDYALIDSFFETVHFFRALLSNKRGFNKLIAKTFNDRQFF